MEGKNDPTILDLDDLNKPAAKVKINKKIIDVYPPTLEELISILQLSTKFQSIGEKKKKYNEKEMIDLFNSLKNFIYKAAPDLEGIDLNIDQVNALCELLSNLASPEDLKELKKRGITVNTGMSQKKTDSVSVEKSPSSSTSTQATPSKV